jgi:MFS family permease
MTVLKPVYATQVLHDSAVRGFMVGCFAAGALTGSALFGVFGHRYSGRLMFAACFVLAGTPPYLTMALGAPLPVLLPVLALSGLAAGALNPMMSTAMYGEVPDGMRARVFGALTAGVAASMPLGALLGGLAVEQAGLVPTLATCAALYLVLGASPLFIRGFAGLSAARDHGGAEAEVETEAAMDAGAVDGLEAQRASSEARRETTAGSQ